ncbi:DUF4870 domain-containing protein [Nostoc sp. LEGE 06077]|uniref:DUF4870 domain-containing protein n=1 Tax=Nostoc sp. LEGE 06077 TaxID=915325 RepID=UPI0018808421|nr:DUF4870 domain-containing protein [Nostoc sp. LEGE 06077]MBE9210012.1 DUF4870 domain-containing protein [Nostoc sp. LEGE 06077]
MYDPDKRKLLSALCHGAIFLSTTFVSVGIPIAMLFIANDPVVLENAKESINFHFNVWIYGIIITAFIWLTFGLLFPLIGIGYLLHWGLTIWAIASVFTNPDQPFRYPFIFRVL